MIQSSDFELARHGNAEKRQFFREEHGPALTKWARSVCVPDDHIPALLSEIWEDFWNHTATYYCASKMFTRDLAGLDLWIIERSAIWVWGRALLELEFYGCADPKAAEEAWASYNALRSKYYEAMLLCAWEALPPCLGRQNSAIVPNKSHRISAVQEELYIKINEDLYKYARKQGLPEIEADEAAHDASRWTIELGKYDRRRGSFRFWLMRWYVKPAIRKIWNRKKKVKKHPNELARTATEIVNAMHARLRGYENLFRLTFLCGGLPHQVLAFGFSHLIHGDIVVQDGSLGEPTRRKGRAWGGKPEVVVTHHSEQTLFDMGNEFLRAYGAESQLDNTAIAKGFAPTRQRMELKPVELLHGRHEASDLLPTLTQDECVGYSMFQSYYGKTMGPTQSVSNWCERVFDRIAKRSEALAKTNAPGRRRLSEAEDKLAEFEWKENEWKQKMKDRWRFCGRCSLRDLPPCGNDRAPAAKDR